MIVFITWKRFYFCSFRFVIVYHFQPYYGSVEVNNNNNNNEYH